MNYEDNYDELVEIDNIIEYLCSHIIKFNDTTIRVDKNGNKHFSI